VDMLIFAIKKERKVPFQPLAKKKLREIIPDYLLKATVVVATISPR